MRESHHHGAPTFDLPAADVGVYLDTNVVRDIADALSGTWVPPRDPDRSDRQRIAAARLFFYGYRDRCGWFLVTSGEARRELMQRDTFDWTLGRIADLDTWSDAPPVAEVERLAKEHEDGGLDATDARHLARVVLHGWIGNFVSNDDKLRRKADHLGLPGRLRVISALEAERELDIKPGEHPPIAPAPGTVLASAERWWIPPAR